MNGKAKSCSYGPAGFLNDSHSAVVVCISVGPVSSQSTMMIALTLEILPKFIATLGGLM
jgi:hypothetical protein